MALGPHSLMLVLQMNARNPVRRDGGRLATLVQRQNPLVNAF